jgi:hypothetical protein
VVSSCLLAGAIGLIEPFLTAVFTGSF